MAAKEKKKNSFNKMFSIVVLFFLVFILSLWFFTPQLVKIWECYLPLAYESLGVFGDQFGAVTALFTGLAFLVVGAALIYQMREFRLQRTEYLENRRALDKQNALTERQIYAQEDANKLTRLRLKLEYTREMIGLEGNSQQKRELYNEIRGAFGERIQREYKQDPDYLAKYKD